MEQISPIIVTGEKEVITRDIRKISEFVRAEYYKITGTSTDAEDINALNPFLYSTDFDFVAQYNVGFDAVGFYKVHLEDNLTIFRHATEEELEGTEFTIKEVEIKSVLEDVLPPGDVLVKFYDDGVIALNNVSVDEYISGDWDNVTDIYYTGLSTGQTEIQVVRKDLV